MLVPFVLLRLVFCCSIYWYYPTFSFKTFWTRMLVFCLYLVWISSLNDYYCPFF